MTTRRALGGLLCVLLLSGAACRSQGNSAPEAPQERSAASPRAATEAPPFRLMDLSGSPVALSDFKGKVVFVDFWASWCPPCRVSMPEVEKIHADYTGKALQVLGLNIDSDPEAARAFAKKKGIPYPVLLAGDSDVSDRYGVEGIPHFAVIDQNGRLVESWSGYSSDMPGAWRRTLDRLLLNPATSPAPAGSRTY